VEQLLPNARKAASHQLCMVYVHNDGAKGNCTQIAWGRVSFDHICSCLMSTVARVWLLKHQLLQLCLWWSVDATCRQACLYALAASLLQPAVSCNVHNL
jgi:hypothetical protein